MSDSKVQEVDHLKSTMLPADVFAKYTDSVTKLKSKLAALDLEDHEWHLKSYDLNGIGIVQLFYRECHKKFGGVDGDHSKADIHNLFANFKAKHL